MPRPPLRLRADAAPGRRGDGGPDGVVNAPGCDAVDRALPLVALPAILGFVEAVLVGTLTLAGVSAGDATLATLAHRPV